LKASALGVQAGSLCVVCQSKQTGTIKRFRTIAAFEQWKGLGQTSW